MTPTNSESGMNQATHWGECCGDHHDPAYVKSLETRLAQSLETSNENDARIMSLEITSRTLAAELSDSQTLLSEAREENKRIAGELGHAKELAEAGSFALGYYEGWIEKRHPDEAGTLKSHVNRAWAIAKASKFYTDSRPTPQPAEVKPEGGGT